MKSRDELDTWIKYEPVIDIYKRIINLDTDKEYINELGNLNTEALNENKERLSYMDLSGILYLMIKLKRDKSKK